MDGKRGRLKLRRSSRRLQGTSKKGYREEGSESESDGSEILGGGDENSKLTRSGGGHQGGRKEGTTKGSSSGSSVGQHFKWSLQSEMVIKQLGKLFWESGGGGGGGGTGGLMNTDVTLVSSEGDCVHAHKVVLVLCCPYFQRLFGKINGTVAKENTVVVMGNVKTISLKNIIRFIYTGGVDVASGDDKEFLKIGEFLGIAGIHSGPRGDTGGGGDPVPSNSSGEGVIKVHVIHKKKNGDEGRDTANVKVEPPNYEDSGTSYFDDNFGDSMDGSFGGGDGGGGEGDDFQQEGDQDSNFSDLIRGGDSESSGGRRQARNEYNSEEDTMGRGAYKGLWTRTESRTAEDLKENWRIKRHDIGVDGYESWTYYCAHGGQRLCGTCLKRVIIDGEEKFYSNRVPHGKHREGSVGLPKETKIFVRSMMEQGIRKPEKIFKAMKLLSMDLPTRAQLVNFIKYTLRKSGQEFPIPERLHPVRKRVREYKPRLDENGQPRPRGRPKVKVSLPKLNIWGQPCDGTRGARKKPKNEDSTSALQSSSVAQTDVKLQSSSSAPPTEASIKEPESSGPSQEGGGGGHQDHGGVSHQHVPHPHSLHHPPEESGGNIPHPVHPLPTHPYGMNPGPSSNQFMNF